MRTGGLAGGLFLVTAVLVSGAASVMSSQCTPHQGYNLCQDARSCCPGHQQCYDYSSTVSVCLSACPAGHGWACEQKSSCLVHQGYHLCKGNEGCCPSGTKCYAYNDEVSACLSKCPPGWGCQARVGPNPTCQKYGGYSLCKGNEGCCSGGYKCYAYSNEASACLKKCPRGWACEMQGGSGAGVVAAKEAAKGMATGFNLGQLFDNDQHPRTFATAKAKIDAYYKEGYRNVRIPVTWTEKIGGTALANINTGEVDRGHQRLKVIESVVDYALSQPGLYVVINAHHEKTLKTEAKGAVLERLWQDISDIFRDRDHRLIYEILNEPHREENNNEPMDAADLRSMTGKAYAKIRAVNPKRIIMIGGNQWFAAHEVPKVWKNLNDVGRGEDKYLMATFHHYNPWTFHGDHQGDYKDNWTERQMEDPMKTMEAWANSVGKGMPVYIGEWGTGWGSLHSSMTCNNIRQWYQLFDKKYASRMGQPTAVWDDGGWFMIFDHKTGKYNNNLYQCIKGTCAWDGQERFNYGC